MSLSAQQRREKYGELAIIGFNGRLPRGDRGRKRSKITLYKRPEANGIKLTKNIVDTKTSEPELLRSDVHSITYAFPNSTAVIMEYDSDKDTDMFQIGRSSAASIDFVIMETASIQRNVMMSRSSVSRFACRILIDRQNPKIAKIFAGGFNDKKSVHLGDKAINWWKKDDTIDGMTTNGVLISHPTEDFCGGDSQYGCWSEVSVGGDLYSLRKERKSRLVGKIKETENNILKDGTLINLCGVTLLWRSAEGLSKTPDKIDVEELVQNLNDDIVPDARAVKNNLVIPRKPVPNLPLPRPYAFVECGHVHFFKKSDLINKKCPLCHLSGPYIKLYMGLEPVFYVDYGPPVYAFKPCGHMATEKTVKFWSKAEIPYGGTNFIAVCPFCARPLDGFPGYVELSFRAYTN
ncbi:hypothetical protein TSAR_016313 [Trichomalopsis sarcophagae]|uniref:Protein pellino n=1 Tax=Trichomalopsis sarcophagae TaxID=543379 RepID=A0A232FAN7_9HYME|nr:hypothetical protein TSAR_016313 [Trichomalopsis sarcophagae]